MSKPLKGVSVAKATKLIAHHVDSITCLECCKYYIAPERATCGHTLCHSCWRGRRVCPACGTSLERRALRLDKTLQSRTEHIRLMLEAFEQFVGVKMDEFMMDMPLEEKEPEDDPTKNVKEWLTSSDNHFSAPPYSDTQQSTQEPPQQILLSTSKIQIHNSQTNKSISSEKVVHVSVPQDDWDNIEVLPDSDDICGKRKTSMAGPMDLEPFYVDDNEYSNDKPRRSSRKRENNNNSSKITVSPNKQLDKHSSYMSAAENEKKLDKAKQNWAQVKKMKKEFSKLNKVNRNKLNISIEMCKKTQSGNSKQNSTTPPISNLKEIVIDDNTPDLLSIRQRKEQATLSNKENLANNTNGTQNNRNLEENVDTLPCVNMEIDNDLVCRKATQSNKEEAEQISNTLTEEERLLQKKITKLTQDKPTEHIPVKPNDEKKNFSGKQNKMSVVKVPFFKTVPIQDKTETVEPVNINIPSNAPASDDDIHITIRIGDVVTNITINKKRNDVQLKVNTDQEVQTSLDSNTTANVDIVRPETREVEVQTSVEENKAINSATQVIIKKSLAALDKSLSTKKNTASAETATAQFEITESVEKELSKIMECQDESENQGNTQQSTKSNKTGKKITQTSVESKATTKNAAKSQAPENAIPDFEPEEPDIFNSGSVKEQHIQLLKTTKSTQSEILLPTHRTNRMKTQKTIDKRLRELDENDEMETINKRQKTNTQDTRNTQFDNSIPPKDKTLENESTNYDEVMGQVFASIDADIQASQAHKGSKTKGHTQTGNPKVTQKDTEHIELVASQTILKPATEKDSENMFSTAGNMLEKGNAHVPGPETQRHIENLLTPGMCQDLASSQGKHGIRRADSEVVVLGTPMEEDDSDKSVVEETPQKNKTSSLTKADSGNRTAVTVKSLQLIKPPNKVDGQKLTAALGKGQTLGSQDIGSIINLTETVRESCRVKESADPKTHETPLTINRFVDQIKHKSTPVARKSLNFTKDSIEDDDITLYPTDVAAAKTTQEKEFMADAFENRPNDPVRRPVDVKCVAELSARQPFLIAGSCLTAAELTNLKLLCFKKGWNFTDKYTPDLTHLVVSVDEELRAQRSVKYMCALAAGKLIVAYEWVVKSLENHLTQSALPYEALDWTGDPGPNRSRNARVKIFHNITFYCMPPFSNLETKTLESMLTAAGGRVVRDIKEAAAGPGAPSVVLAEPEHTQEDRFMYLAMQHGIVPVNYEWALNCLGTYTLLSIHDLLLCPSTILPKAVKQWRVDLFSRDDDDSLTYWTRR